MTPVIDNPGQYLPGIDLPPRLRLHPDSPLDNLDTLILPDATVQAALASGPLGIHFADGVYSEGEWFGTEPNYSTILHKLSPAWVNLLGGAQYNEARQRAAWVTTNLPARVIWRHYKHIPPGQEKPTDGGLWKLPAPEWVNNIGLAHGYEQTGWYILTDNEPGMADWTPYVRWLCDLIPLAIAAGLRLAVLRFSTHNPSYAQIDSGVFDPALRMIAQYQGPAEDLRIVVSPNWYYSDDNHDGITHIAALVNRMQQVTGRRPVVVIGEYAYAQNLDPNKGWRAAGLSESATLDGLRVNYELLIRPRGFNALPYCAGTLGGEQVTTFHLDKRMLDAMAEMMASVTPIEPPEDAGVPTLPGKDSSMWKDAQLRIDRCRIRSAPFVLTADGHVPGLVRITVGVGSNLKVWLPEPTYTEDEYIWVGAWFGDVIGWMALVNKDKSKADALADQFLIKDDPVPEPPVDPPPPAEETPPVGNPTLTAEDVRAIFREEWRAALGEIVGIVLELISGWQAGENSSAQSKTLSINEAITQLEQLKSKEIA